MSVSCPHCGEPGVVSDDAPEARIVCGRCGEGFHVSGGSGQLNPRALFGLGLEEPADAHPGDWEPPTPDELTAILTGYRVDALIACGGMGVVYRAWQLELERPVAIKLLPPRLSEDVEFLERFRREARTLARLDHPGVIHVYDVGRTAAGHPYFVMEFVDGTDLQHLIQGPGLSPQATLDITAQICDALQYAHEHGVIHRDIKPANVLITRTGRVKLVDFGLARPLRHDQAADLTLTRTAMGTPDYMAPEQKDGEGDHRVDLYALGVMLYEMLCGKRPQGAWEPPSHCAAVDPRLDKIVVRAMQEEPDRRYQNASEVRTEVDKIRGVSMPGSTGKADAGPARARGWISAAVVVLAAVGIAAAWFARRGDPPQSLPPAQALPQASRDAPWENSLGMKFLPVPSENVLLCAHETTEANWAPFLKATGHAWERFADPTVSGKIKPPDHPIGGVSWHDANAYCEWLTRKEHADGRLAESLIYRLPTDREWSQASGLDEEAGVPPRELSGKLTAYSWGTQWPPPTGTVNVGDVAAWPVDVTPENFREKLRENVGLVDRFEETCPVEQFPPDDFGFLGLTGNVAEWVADPWTPGHNGNGFRILRGSGWFTPSKGGPPWMLRFQDSSISGQLYLSREATRIDPAEFLKLSHREAEQPVARWPQNGFRVALALAAAPLRQSVLPLESGTIENSLGMHLLPKGDPKQPSSYMSRWETRVRDYAVFVKETGREWASPPFPQTPDHPAVMVSFADCMAFCEWLTARESQASRIPQGWVYRLPSRAEWTEAMLPADWLGTDSRAFRDWCCLPADENVRDGLWNRSVLGRADWQTEQRCNDGFAYSSPVGSHAGLRPGRADGPVFYDVGGNVFERNLNSIVPSDTPRGSPVLGNAFSKGHWNSFDLLKSLPESPREDIGFRVMLTPQRLPVAPTRESLSAVRPLATFEHGGSRYAVLPVLADWEESKVLAETLGGHLATVNSPEEGERIKAALSGILADEDEIFLGAVRVQGDGNSFQWITGEAVPASGFHPDGSNRMSRYGQPGDRLGYRKSPSGIFLTDLASDEETPSRRVLVEWD